MSPVDDRAMRCLSYVLISLSTDKQLLRVLHVLYLLRSLGDTP